MSPDEPSYVALGDAATVPPGEIAAFEVAGRGICVAHLEDGRWGAIDDMCTHEHGVLSQGEVDDRWIECPRHGSRFDLLTGEVSRAPAKVPVRAYPVRVRDGKIEVALGSSAAR